MLKFQVTCSLWTVGTCYTVTCSLKASCIRSKSSLVSLTVEHLEDETGLGDSTLTKTSSTEIESTSVVVLKLLLLCQGQDQQTSDQLVSNRQHTTCPTRLLLGRQLCSVLLLIKSARFVCRKLHLAWIEKYMFWVAMVTRCVVLYIYCKLGSLPNMLFWILEITH